MESVFDRAGKMANTQLTKVRWALGLNGRLAVASGVVILVWPSISLFALTILFGAWTLATGVVGFAAALSGATTQERGWLALSSLLGIGVGAAVLIWPNISELALLYVIGAYAVALGVFAVIGAFYLPLDGGDTALLVLSGLVSILFGIVSGISELVVAIGGKRLVESSLKQGFAPSSRRTSRTPQASAS